MWVVDVETESGFSHRTPRLLFDAPYTLDPIGVGFPNYDVSLDGQQFLMVMGEAAEIPGYVVILNWFEELKRLVPID